MTQDVQTRERKPDDEARLMEQEKPTPPARIRDEQEDPAHEDRDGRGNDDRRDPTEDESGRPMLAIRAVARVVAGEAVPSARHLYCDRPEQQQAHEQMQP